MNILMALMRFGSRYWKGLSRPGLRVAGKASKKRRVRGVLKRGKKGNFVISNQGVPHSVTLGDASRLSKSAKRMSTVRKGLVGGGVGGAGIVGFATGANKGASPGPSLKQKKAPSMASTTPAGFTSKGGKWVKKKQSFGQAFSKAREKGEGTEFSWQGKDYVAVTKDDLKKRGLKNLGEWQKRKKSIKTLKKKGLMMRKVSKKA